LLSPCALCQEYRELELRGVDMACTQMNAPMPPAMKK